MNELHVADTRRGISWSLERPCPLRRSADWPLPEATWRELRDVSSLSHGLREKFVLDDVCVTGYTLASDSERQQVELPTSGFRVGLALAPFGGEDAVRAACGGCEANVASGEPPGLAGCLGFLDAWPDSKELDAHLRDRIRLKGLDDEVARMFAQTTPLWYGLWIESPLRRPQCEALLALLDGTDDPDKKQDDDVRYFVAALRAAVAWELPLHVAMAPPGHTDFGWYTVFPHCPRCKAHAPVARWQESYADESINCAVCGHCYSLAATHKMERMDESDWEAARLENLLGGDAVDGFRRRFMAHQGHSAEQIDDVLDRRNNGPLKRRINELRRRQSAVRRSMPVREPTFSVRAPELTLDLGGDVTMRLRLIPAGEFLMGTAGPPDEAGNEQPQHVVRIARPFYLGEFPVTQAQYEAVMGRNPSRFRGDTDRPVEQVTWFAAHEFCLRLSQTVGRGVRLPSEAEWEYACRAGTSTKYHWGEEVATDQVNCKTGDVTAMFLSGTKAAKQPSATNVQGRYPPNAWGLYDMHGNVQEWCEDEYHASYEGAPADGSARFTPGDENPFRPLRGGSCWHHAAACTSTGRQQLRADANEERLELPEDDPVGSLLRDRPPVGFRIVVEVD